MIEQYKQQIMPGEQERKEDGENIILQVYLQRHGPKLSATGEKNERATYFDKSVRNGFKKMGIEDGGGLVHISSSPVERAVKTADIELAEISSTKHSRNETIRKEKKLEVPFQPLGEMNEVQGADDLNIIVRMQQDLEPVARQTVTSKHPELTTEEKEAEIRNIIDMQVLTVLFDKKKAKKAGFQTTYDELADSLALRYGGFLRHAEFLKSKMNNNQSPQSENEPYKQIDVSHSFLITSFLKKYLIFDDGISAKDMTAEDFFNKIGGVIKESQSLRMDYYEKNDGKYGVKVKGNFSGNKPFSGQLNL